MGPKLLFVVGIVVTHAAVGAALMTREPLAPVAVSSCVYAPDPPAPFPVQAEMLAMRVSTVTPLESLQP